MSRAVPPAATVRRCPVPPAVPGPPVHRVRLRHEVARLQAEPAQQREDLPQLTGAVAAHPEPGRHQVPGRAFRDLPAEPGDLGQRAAAVAGVGPADDHALLLQPVDGVGDAGGMDHQPLTDHPQRQRATAAEGQQDQRLVAGKGELVRPEQAVELGQQELLCAHDRGHGGHRVRRAELLFPDLGGPRDRVKRQVQTLRHMPTLPARPGGRAACGGGEPGPPRRCR